jgi:hypothetical protein
VAPAVAIFCGALWGSRKFYGWPDAGPIAGQAALIACLVLCAVLIGTRVKSQHDVPASKRKAEELAGLVRTWSERNSGMWPASFDEAGIPPTRSSMGLLFPPHFEFEIVHQRPRIGFPIGGRRRLILDVLARDWREGSGP